jgi:hypothetical protein
MRRSIPRFGPGPEGAPATFTPSLPVERPWRVSSGGVGGHAVAASGIPESYVVRVDGLVQVNVRCLESEWPQLLAWVQWMRASGQPAPFRFYHNEPATEHLVYLHHPTWQDGDIEPEPSTQSRGSYGLTLTLRRSTIGQHFLTPWRLVVDD